MSSTPKFGQFLPAQNFTTPVPSPIGRPRPISGLPTRGVILSAPDLEDCSGQQRLDSVTVDTGINGPAKADVLVQLASPAQILFLSSLASSSVGISIFFHLGKLNKAYTGNAIAPQGNEAWIQLSTQAGVEFTNILHFRKPISQFYLDIGYETGAAQHAMTFLYSDDGFDITYFPRG